MPVFEFLEYTLACFIGFIVGFYIIKWHRREKVADGDVVRALEIVLEIVKRITAKGGNVSQFVEELKGGIGEGKNDFYVPPVFQNAEKNFESSGQKIETKSDIDKNAEILRKSMESRTRGR